MNTDQRIAVGVDGRPGQDRFPSRAGGSVRAASGAHAPCLLVGQDTAAQRAPQGKG
jgi:hypothetical protein